MLTFETFGLIASGAGFRVIHCSDCTTHGECNKTLRCRKPRAKHIGLSTLLVAARVAALGPPTGTRAPLIVARTLSTSPVGE